MTLAILDIIQACEVDIILVGGPVDPNWHMQTSFEVVKFWKNLGNFAFNETTLESGLSPINGYYPHGSTFLGIEETVTDKQFFGRGSIFGDFNNDGWIDLVYLDSRETPSTETDLFHNILFMNQGDGTFEPMTIESSGITSNSITGLATDINNDGLLDLYFARDPSNSSNSDDNSIADDRFPDHVYINTGSFGGAENHWLVVRFTGITDDKLIGARVYVYKRGTAEVTGSAPLGMRVVGTSNHVKAGQELSVHFGLAAQTSVDVRIEFPDGSSVALTEQLADRQLIVDMDK